MDIKAIRLARLRQLIAARHDGKAGRCADFMHMKRPQVNRWVTGNPEARQGISEDSARAIEDAHGLRRGWLDADPDEDLDILQTILDETDLIEIRPVRFILTDPPGYQVELAPGTTFPIRLSVDWLRSAGIVDHRLYAVRAEGERMAGSLFAGDTAVVNTRDAEPVDGQVYAAFYEGAFDFYRLKRDLGEWWLTSDNADKRRYADKRLDAHASLIGRVIYKASAQI